MSAVQRCAEVATGVFLDRLTPEPPDRSHPVAWFGSAMGRMEELLWSDRRLSGVAYAGVGVGLGALAGFVVRSTAAMVTLTVAGRQLRMVAGSVGERLTAGDLDGARSILPALVGRDPSELDEAGVAAAVIESIAENSVDAVVAPVVWALAGGAPAAAAYRAINTMDAMVGHRSDRYRNFGWAAARLDDAANYVPARVLAALVLIHAPGRRRDVVRAVRADAPAHPSPNAGVAEAAFAAALGVRLGGSLRYGERTEHRPVLGRGERPTPADLDRAIRLAARIEGTLMIAFAAVGAIGLLSARWPRRVQR